MFNTIETRRLVLRSFREGDGADLYEYLSDPEVCKYEPYSVFTEEGAKKEALSRSENPSFIAVCLKGDTHKEEKLIGNIYFAQSEPEFTNTYEIGYVFNRAFHGNGYATEAASAILKYVFTKLKAHRVIAMCNTKNTASWRLMERLDMRREAVRFKNMFFSRDEAGNPLWFDSYQYAILSTEWEQGVNRFMERQKA